MSFILSSQVMLDFPIGRPLPPPDQALADDPTKLHVIYRYVGNEDLGEGGSIAKTVQSTNLPTMGAG